MSTPAEEAIKALVAGLSPWQLEQVINGSLRLGDSKASDLAIWNAAIDCANGYEDSGHDCWENAVPYVSDGPLGHGWECGICGAFLQAG